MSDTPVFRWDRRMFLRGAGGAVLALPLLPSLLSPREAKAQAAQRPKCFVHFRTPHGAIFGASMWPTDAALTQSLFYADHDVRRGDLVATPNTSGDAAISRGLTAKPSVLTPTLVSKMNILRGLDFPLYMGHNFGAPLGYYDFDKQWPGSPRATIDQVMAYSPAFYPSVASVRKRSVAIAGSGTSTGSWGYSTPGVRSSSTRSSSHRCSSTSSPASSGSRTAWGERCWMTRSSRGGRRTATRRTSPSPSRSSPPGARGAH